MVLRERDGVAHEVDAAEGRKHEVLFVPKCGRPALHEDAEVAPVITCLWCMAKLVAR
jgi:hypothetical protein